MRNNFQRVLALSAALGVAVTAAWAAHPTGLTQKESGKGAVSQNMRPVVKLANAIKEDLQPIPNLPMQRYIVGQGLVNGGVAGGPTGDLVYENPSATFLYPPGAGVMIADDIRTNCAGSMMTKLEIGVGGGGDGTGPGFDVTFELYDDCPNAGDPGQPIPGTQGQATLPTDGLYTVVLDLTDAPVQVPGSFWLAMTVSTASAGWLVGDPATIGESDDIFDGPFPCTTFFGGCPPNPCASFNAKVYATDCLSVYLAYESDAFSGFFTGLALSEQFADEMLPISAPALCDVTQYCVELAGLDGAYTMTNELWSDDEANLRPLAPIPGTLNSFNGNGNGFLELSCLEISPPAPSPTALIWVTYDVAGNEAGPILAADFPGIGFSEDCFSIFGNPDAGQYSQCVWFFGGCPQDETGNPCGTFNASLSCAGTEPAGACCDVVTPDTPDCVDNVPTTQCGGRFKQNETCAAAQYNPPCGTASCCKPDDTCENLTETACDTAGGIWQAGQFCGVDTQTCPPAACVLATNACDVVSDFPGCNDPFCCSLICGIDDFCCAVAWDETCVGNANALCPQPPVDECADAIEITCGGSIVLDNTLATNVNSDPGYSCHNGGVGDPGIGSVWAKFTATSTSVRLATCNSPAPADDSLLAVYSGTCGALTEIGCSDDVVGCAATDFNSEICVSNLTIGNTYYIQLGAWTEADRGAYTLEMQCPAPATCGPPPPPANDACNTAIPVTNGTYTFSTLSSTTDGPALPAGPQPNGCDEGFGLGIGLDIWYNYTATASGTVTVDLCTDTDYDSRVVVYNTCACPAQIANTHECDDDGCCAPDAGCASSMEFSANAGQCYKIRVAGFGAAESGSGEMTISSSGTGPNCPDGAVTFVNPQAGTVDARQPNPVNSLTPPQGISTLTVTAPVGAEDGCFRMCETNAIGGPNSITNVTDNGAGTYTLTLARPITRGAVTRVSYNPTAGAATTATLISHPANVNADTVASPIDILRIIDCLNGINVPVNCPWGVYSQDIDHSGVFGPSDILRVIDLLNGADVYDPWNNTTLPAGTCTP